MDLWIRNQDRDALIPIKDVITEFSEALFYQSYILGQYKTKERALEVLDEIQKLLMPQMKVIHNKTEEVKLNDFTRDVIIQPMIEDIQIRQASSYVYEMPKE